MKKIITIVFIAILGAGVLYSMNSRKQDSAALRTDDRQTVVLVHGAWMDASAWDKVAPLLRDKGFDVVAVNLPGHGLDATPAAELTLDSYAAAVTAAIGEKTDVILVGHSMGGIVISQVAERIPAQIDRLVYVAGYLPQNGESLYQISQADAESLVGKYWRQDDPAAYTPASIAEEGIVETFAADAPAEDTARIVATHKAEAVPPLGTPVVLGENFAGVKKVYITTRQDRAVGYTLQQSMIAQANVDAVYEIDSSHSPFFSKPAELADLIVQE